MWRSSPKRTAARICERTIQHSNARPSWRPATTRQPTAAGRWARFRSASSSARGTKQSSCPTAAAAAACDPASDPVSSALSPPLRTIQRCNSMAFTIDHVGDQLNGT